MSRVAILRFTGEISQGLQVVLEWGDKDQASEGRLVGRLTANKDLPQLYHNWQNAYRNLEELYRTRGTRLELETVYVGSQEDCAQHAHDLGKQLNEWLDFRSPEFRAISRQLNIELSRHPTSQMLIQTNDPQLQKLPWQLWNFWDHHRSVEVMLSPLEYRPHSAPKKRSQIRLLAVLGDSSKINISVDQLLLKQLPGLDPSSCFLEQPSRSELEQNLRDQEGWDILFFAGHSCSEKEAKQGRIYINATESLSIHELKHSLSDAIEQGLQLAIFNSCDGLGLANSLVELQIPQTIVMREPVPDEVAHKFLEFFLQDFSQGVALPQAVKRSRERLEVIQDKLPYATWLPLMYQHPTAPSLQWQRQMRQDPKAKNHIKLKLGYGISALALLFLAQTSYRIFTAPLPLGDGQSSGEEMLDNQDMPRELKLATELIAECQRPLRSSISQPWHELRQQWKNCHQSAENYRKAAPLFATSWREDGRHPETLIYLNNALIEAQGLEHYTIAVGVPIIRAEDGTVTSSNLAKELLRGVVHLQTQVNSKLIDRDLAGSASLPELDADFELDLPVDKTLKVVIVDDSNQEAKALSNARLLAKQKDVLGIVGHYSSEMSLATVDIYDRHGLPQISPGSTTEELTKEPRSVFFRTVPTTGIEAQSIVDYLIDKEVKKVVILYNPDSPFTASLWREFQMRYRAALGSDYRNDSIESINLASPNFDAEALTKRLKNQPDVGIVLVPDGQVSNSFPNAVEVIRLDQGRHEIAASWGVYSPNTLAIADQTSLNKLMISTPWHHLNSPNLEFPIAAEQLWGGTVNTRTATAYDAALVLAKAIAAQDNPSRRGVLKTLRSKDFKVEGVTGSIQFEADNGNRLDMPQELVHVRSCPNRQHGLTFVPRIFDSAEAAGLVCN